MFLDMTVQNAYADQAGVERQVNGDDRLNKISAASQIGHRPQRVGQREATPLNDVALRKRGSSHLHSGSAANRDTSLDRCLDWIARRHVEAENPAGGSA
jgi:hypothetical protein